jgi:hypothetical protein
MAWRVELTSEIEVMLSSGLLCSVLFCYLTAQHSSATRYVLVLLPSPKQAANRVALRCTSTS